MSGLEVSFWRDRMDRDAAAFVSSPAQKLAKIQALKAGGFDVNTWLTTPAPFSGRLPLHDYITTMVSPTKVCRPAENRTEAMPMKIQEETLTWLMEKGASPFAKNTRGTILTKEDVNADAFDYLRHNKYLTHREKRGVFKHIRTLSKAKGLSPDERLRLDEAAEMLGVKPEGAATNGAGIGSGASAAAGGQLATSVWRLVTCRSRRGGPRKDVRNKGPSHGGASMK